VISVPSVATNLEDFFAIEITEDTETALVIGAVLCALWCARLSLADLAD